MWAWVGCIHGSVPFSDDIRRGVAVPSDSPEDEDGFVGSSILSDGSARWKWSRRMFKDGSDDGGDTSPSFEKFEG